MTYKPWRWGVGALIGIALLVACDGSNLFDAEQNPFSTPRVSVSVPDGAFAGDTLGISVSASSAIDVATIDVAVRGAVTKDTSITVSGRSATATVRVALPQILTDTLLIVGAVATDKNGNVSKVKSDTATVLGPPAIIGVSGPDSLRLGTSSTLQIRAFGSRRITQLDIALRGAVVKDTTITISPALNDVTQSLLVNIPAAAADTALRVGIVAKDVTGISSVPATIAVPLAIAAPTAAVTAPASAAPGGLLNLSVTGTAMRTVTSLKVELRGATNMDTTVTVVPARTPVTQDISIRLPGDMVDPSLTVRAYAIDKAGAVSTPATATVAVNTGVPTISSVTCTSCTGTFQDSTRSGAVVDVRVVAQGVSPLKEIQVRFRGAINQEVVVPVPTSPARTSFTADVSVQLPVEVSDTLLTVTAIAVDQANNISAITSSSTKVLRVSDATAPSVTAQATPGTTSAGSTLQIRVGARDNVGVARIGYAVVNPAGDTIGTAPTLVNTAGLVKDTTFSFSVPLTITPRTVRVLGIAQDASGRRGYSTAASVVVADSAAPSITFNAPTLNSTLPLNDSVRVSVRVQDPTGIKQITMFGQSVRVDSLGPTQTIQRFEQKVISFPINPGAPLPTDTTIVRYLRAIPDSISESVSIIVSAQDSLSNTATSSTSIVVGGPRVELRNPIAGTQVVPGGALTLTAFALDRASGIDSVLISITGAQTRSYLFGRAGSTCPAPAVCSPAGLPSNDSVVITRIDTVGATTGTLTVNATAWNRNRVAGQATPVNVLVSANAVSDVTPPQVRVATTVNDRVELNDTITVNLTAQDVGAAGLRRMGVVVLAQPGGTGVTPDTLYLDSVFVGSGRTGVQPATFKFTLAQMGYDELRLVSLPRTMTFQVHAFAVDTVGNCGASVTNTMTSLPCDSIMPAVSGQPRVYYIARNTAPAAQLTTVVPGFSRALLDPTSTIADVLVDNNPARPRLFLSNMSRNRLEYLDLTNPNNPLQTISVGSEPWGMFLKNAPGGDGLHGTSDDNPDRLIVANSGGTNLSFVNLGTLQEVAAERILTPNAVLFDVTKTVTTSAINYKITYHDFSDRPQFVAQDANEIFLYSTKPTGAAPDGTVRYLQPTPAGTRKYESKILYTRDAFTQADDSWAIANIDSITGGTNGITLWDHTPGFPAATFSSTDLDINTAINNLRVAGSDIDVSAASRWNLEAVGLSDTTYVAASGNRQYVAFGEGQTGPYASVWLWRFGPGLNMPGTLSDNLTVEDLIGNAAERVLGIGLNYNGDVGAARGAVSASYFTNNVASAGDLRLQGVFSNGVAGGNGGVALHPQHASATACTEQTLSFVATGNRSIKIVDTFHFRDRGEIQIRDNIVSALRAALPLATDNTVATLGTGDEVIVKLYGVTGAGKAVIINVRRRDLTNMVGGVCQ